MNYEHVLIVTYGRSGSTLLQGLLNSMDGCLVRGENYNMCHGLFQMRNALLESRAEIERTKTDGESVANPWFGAHLLQEERFMRDACVLVRNQLLAGADPATVQCLGFKEVRYPEVKPDDLPAYLTFLERLFPKSAFVFLTRDHASVSKSAWWANVDPGAINKRLTQMETTVRKWATDRSNFFHIEYTDLAGHSDRVADLFSFMGARYDAAAVEVVLTTPHSYATKGGVRKPGHEQDAEVAAPAAWLDVKVMEEGAVRVGFFDPVPGCPVLGSGAKLGGVVLPAADVPLDAKLVLREPDGVSRDVEWGLPSPVAGAQFPGDERAARARFSLEGIGVKSGVSTLLLQSPDGRTWVVGKLRVAVQ